MHLCWHNCANIPLHSKTDSNEFGYNTVQFLLIRFFQHSLMLPNIKHFHFYSSRLRQTHNVAAVILWLIGIDQNNMQYGTEFGNISHVMHHQKHTHKSLWTTLTLHPWTFQMWCYQWAQWAEYGKQIHSLEIVLDGSSCALPQYKGDIYALSEVFWNSLF